MSVDRGGLALAIATALAGVIGTLIGYTVVLEYAREQPGHEQGGFLLQGLWEVAGSVPNSSAMAGALLLLWAIGRRRAALAAEAPARGLSARDVP